MHSPHWRASAWTRPAATCIPFDPDVQPWLAEGDEITVLWDGGTENLAPGTAWTVTVPAYEPPENGTIRALDLTPAQ